MELLITCIIFYIAGLVTPFISAILGILNLTWKDYVRNERMKVSASKRAKSELAKSQIQIMKALIRGKQNGLRK